MPQAASPDRRPGAEPAEVAFFDYRPLHRRLAGEIDAAIQRVLASGRLVLGPEVESFEREFAAYTGAECAVGVASGTDAIQLALRALGVGAGDEVVTVANAGVPPVAAIRLTGATPRFVDVCPDTLLMDPERLEGAIGEHTRAILPVHLYGQPAAVDVISAVAERHGVALVEDCAQAHGARLRGRHVGGFGAAACYSFYPTKNLGAYGDGGLVATRDRELAERVRRLRMYGFDEARHSRCEGVMSRLDELQAAILRVKLTHLDASLRERRSLARRYLDALAGGPCEPVAVAPEVEHARHLFVVRSPDREAHTRALARAAIGFGVHYPEPVHRMQAYAFLGYGEGSLPESERASREVLSLPLYPGLGDSAQDRVIEALLAAGRA